jgi:hypothetical protein
MDEDLDKRDKRDAWIALVIILICVAFAVFVAVGLE